MEKEQIILHELLELACRLEVKVRRERLGDDEVRALLERVDPASAGRIHPGDRYRLQRALEIQRVTGRPMSELIAERRRRKCHLEQHPGGVGARIELEHERIAALESDGPFAFARQPNQDGVDFLLGHGVVLGLLTNAAELGLRVEIEWDGVGRQPIVDHHVGGV